MSGLSVHGAGAALTVGALATQRQPLLDALTCREVDEWFRQDEARRSAVLERPDGSAGLLNRSVFYQYLLGPLGFGWALHAQKPVAMLPLPIGLIIDADTPAIEAGLELLEQQIHSGDDLLVVGGSAPATIAASTLLAQLARAQREQAGRLEALLQNLSDVIVVVDEAAIVSYISSSAQDLTGYKTPDQVGQSCLDNIHPDDQASVRRLLATACERPDITIREEVRLRSTSGEYLLVSVAATDQRCQEGIGGIVLTYRDITENRAFEEELRHRALHDGLTGLANRALLKDRTTHALAGAGRSGACVALMYIDLDGFKEVNDGWGHASGDAVLQAVADVLRANSRPADTVARIGGDEFVVLLEHLHTRSDASGFASRLHHALEEIELDGLHITISCSVGIAAAEDLSLHPAPGNKPLGNKPPGNKPGGTRPTGTEAQYDVAEELIRRADAAMYLAKSEGRSRTKWWEEYIDREALTKDRLRAQLFGAAERNELRLHYQPIVNLADGIICGVEALVRWEHPADGLIPPAVFIPLSELNGAITSITAWVLQRACTEGRQIGDGASPLIVAINISAVELARPELAEEISTVLSTTGFPPSHLELEITETALISNFTRARSSIMKLKALGATIAIDDFGTGYSSLSYLHELPVDRVKIDRAFTHRVNDPAGANLIRGVIDIAHSLKLQVTAEGIETAAQAEALTGFDCDQGQGYFYSHPVPVEELAVRPVGNRGSLHRA